MQDEPVLTGVWSGAGALGAAPGTFLPSPPPRTGRNGRPILTLKLRGQADNDADEPPRAA
jgi:hypothetical protein